MKVKLLKKIRNKFIITPNIDGMYGFYIISKKSGLVYNNNSYGSEFCVEILINKTFGTIRSYLIKRIHEQNVIERRSNTILNRLVKSNK